MFRHISNDHPRLPRCQILRRARRELGVTVEVVRQRDGQEGF